MSVRDLQELDGAEKAINEIYDAYLKQKNKSEPKGKQTLTVGFMTQLLRWVQASKNQVKK